MTNMNISLMIFVYTQLSSYIGRLKVRLCKLKRYVAAIHGNRQLGCQCTTCIMCRMTRRLISPLVQSFDGVITQDRAPKAGKYRSTSENPSERVPPQKDGVLADMATWVKTFTHKWAKSLLTSHYSIITNDRNNNEA